MTDYLIDTNVWISLLRGDPTTHSALSALDGRPVLSLIVWGELQTGLHLDPAQRQATALEHIRKTAQMNPLSAEVAETYGRLRSQLRRDGTPIGHNDTWIAAEALTLDQTVVTDNRKHFERISGLHLLTLG